MSATLSTSTPISTDAWAPYVPSAAMPWNRARVTHLHRRAGFAATWEEQDRDLADGPQQAADRLLDGKTLPQKAEDFETMARTIGDAAMASGTPGRLKAWWIYRILFSPDPLGERLTLMWHNHFATSNRKVQDLVLMREQNDLIRTHCRGSFSTLLAAVMKHPAMLVWLDADANRKGKPNENLARETMELFTLGVGNYTEQDVQAAARALTGWAVVNGKFGTREARHDSDPKTLLGKTDSLDGDGMLTILLAQPATPKRLAWRICHTFLGEAAVNEADLSALSDGLRQHDLDIGWAIDTVLRSQLFFSESAMKQRVAGPVEWAIGALRALELTDPPPSTLLLAEWTTRMGQDLFYPPNVGGWSEGRAWLSSQSVVARAKFAAALVEGRLRYPSQAPDLQKLVERHRKADDLTESVSWFMELFWGEANSDAVAEIVAAANSSKEGDKLATAVALVLARPENQLS
jgi:uncharacterized protein (DUF1800 family)